MNLETENEKLRTRMGEMAAEIERLQSAIDAANAQDALGFVFPDDFEKLGNSECAADIYSVEKGHPSRGVTLPVYARPIPAQQSPAVALHDDQNNSESARNIGNEVHNIATALSYSGSESLADELGAIAVRLWGLDKSPRTTEQDAREIIEDYIGFCDGKRLKPQSTAVTDMYLKGELRALLDKLNGVKS